MSVALVGPLLFASWTMLSLFAFLCYAGWLLWWHIHDRWVSFVCGLDWLDEDFLCCLHLFEPCPLGHLYAICQLPHMILSTMPYCQLHRRCLCSRRSSFCNSWGMFVTLSRLQLLRTCHLWGMRRAGLLFFRSGSTTLSLSWSSTVLLPLFRTPFYISLLVHGFTHCGFWRQVPLL